MLPTNACAGYLPASGGLPALEARLAAGAAAADALDMVRASSSGGSIPRGAAAGGAPLQNGAHAAASDAAAGGAPGRRWWRHADGKVCLFPCGFV